MAKSNTMTTVSIDIDAQRAVKRLEQLKERVDTLTDRLSELAAKAKDPRTWGPTDTQSSIEKDFAKTQKDLEKVARDYKFTVKRVAGIDDMLNEISTSNYNTLTQLRTTLINSLKNRKLETEDQIKAYEEAAKRLQKVRDEIAKRDIDVRSTMTEGRAKEVMKSLDTSSYADIKNATETMKKMQAQLEPNSNKWKTYGKQIADATNYLKKWDDQAKRTQMLQATKGDLGKMSDSDLQQQLRYWDGVANGIGRTNVAATQYKKVLETLQAEQAKRTTRTADKVMGKVDAGDLGGSIAEMQNRLKLLQDYRTTIDSTKPDAYVRVDAAIEKLTQGIKESQAGFLSYADAVKQAEGLADGSFKGSIADLDKMKKTLEEYKGTLKVGDTGGLEKVDGLLDNISNKQKELQTGYTSYSQAMIGAAKVMNGSFEGSIADLEKMQKVLTEYRNSLDVKDTDGLKDVDARLQSITQKMQQLKPGFMSFQDAMTEAGKVADGSFKGTLADLKKLQKVLEEGMSAELNIGKDSDKQKLKDTLSLLDDIAKKQKELAELNKREQAEAKVAGVGANIAGSSPAEIEEAIRLAKELQKMNGTSADQYKNLATFINEAEAQLQKWNDQVKESAMILQLQDVTKLSKSALEEQKKYWQAVVDGTKAGDAALDGYKENLQKVIEEERKRTQASGRELVSQYETGNWEKTIGETREAVKQLQVYRDTLKTVGDIDALEKVDKAIEGLNLKIKQAERGYMSFGDAMQKMSDLDHFNGTLEELEKIQKVIKEGMAKELNLSNTADIDRLKQASIMLDDIAKKQKELAELNKREQAEAKVAGVRSNIDNSSPAEIEEAIRLAKELQKMNGTSTTQYQSLALFIGKAEEQLQKWNDQVKKAVMEKKFTQLHTLSKNALEEQQKYWQGVFDNAKKGTAEYMQAERKLTSINKEMTNRNSAEAGAIMGNLKSSSVSDIERAIKMTEELMKAHTRGSQEYEIYAEEIKRAKEYLQGYIDLDKQIDMEDKWSRLPQLSANALAEQKKYWQEMVNGAGQGTKELDEYQAKLAAVTEEEQKRLRTRTKDVMASPGSYSVKEVQDAIKATEQLRDAQARGSSEWQKYNNEIETAKFLMENYERAAKQSAMAAKLPSLGTASTASLAEQKKYWQEMVAGAEQGTQALKDYQENLDKVLTEEKTRIQQQGKQTVTEINTGNWDKTIGETQEAIKLLQEYRNTLNATNDAKALQDLDKALDTLTQKTKEAEQGFVSWQAALAEAANLKNFSGTIEQLEKMKKVLQEARKNKIDIGDTDNLEQIDKALSAIDEKLGDVSEGTIDWKKIMDKDLKDISLNNLKRAAAQLEKEIGRCAESMEDFSDKSEQLRAVNAQIDGMTRRMRDHNNVIISTAKRLASYVAVYGGFNAVWGQMKNIMSSNMQLSDSLADVQKTTGLTAESVRQLSQDIDSIDTRTSQQQLHELAATAGQIGLKSQNDILGFVKASNMITVALNELGSEGTASLMKLAQLTGDVQEMGVEKSLLSIGSAINELSANSAATAGPIVDLMNRMGGIASQSNITTAELAAIGATADALGQSIEITGTSMNKFVSTLMTNSDQIAYALNMDAKALRDMLEGGKTMEAMLAVFEKMNQMGGISALAPVMGDLGSEGARMTQLFSAMAGNVEFLRDQVDLSREAFAEASSIQDEYNVKNENAIALWERMGNIIKESFVNSGFVQALTSVTRLLYDFVKWLAEGEAGARALKALVIAVGSAFLLASLHTDKFVKSLIKAKTWTDAMSLSLKNLKKAFNSNWISLLIGALASLGYYIYETITHVSKLNKVTNEYNAQLDRENNIMKSLFNGLQNENLTKKEKTKILGEINKRYGEYLGFLVSERDSVEELAAAYELANAKMRETMAVRMGNKQKEILDEQYGQQMAEDRTDLMSKLEKGSGTAGREKEAMSVVRRLTMENIDKDIKEIRVLISNEFERLFGHSSAFAAPEIKQYIETQKEYYDEFALINGQAEQDLKQAQEATAKANVDVMEKMFKQVQDLSTGVTKVEADGPFKSALDIQRGIVQEGQQFIDYASKNLESLTDEQRAKVDANIKIVKQQMAEARKQLPETDPWSKSTNVTDWKEFADVVTNLDTSSAEALVSAYKKITEDTAKIPSDVKAFYKMFEDTGLEAKLNLQDPNDVAKQVHNWAEQIKDKLKSKYGRNTSGAFIFDSDGSGDKNSAEKQARKELNAVMAALEEHFLKRKAVIQQAYLDEKISNAEMNRQIADNDEEFRNARIELRKELVGEANTFNQSLYPELKGKDIQRTAKFLQQIGDVVTDGIRKNIQKDEVEIRDGAIKIRQAFEAEILKGDYFGSLADNFRNSMDELMLLSSEYERNFGKAIELGTNGMVKASQTKGIGLSEDEQKQRLNQLQEWAQSANLMTDKMLEDMMLKEGKFSSWLSKLNEDEIQVLINKLRDYKEAYDDVVRKEAERMKKRTDARFEATGQQKAAQQRIAGAEGQVESVSQLESMGVEGLEPGKYEAEIELIKQKMSYQIQWIALLQQEQQVKMENLRAEEEAAQKRLDNAKTDEERANAEIALAEIKRQIVAQTESYNIAISESNQKMLDLQKEASNSYLQQMTRHFDTLNEYSDQIDDFALAMGKGIYGSKEDRQQAAKDLLSSVLTTTKTVIQTWLMELTMKKAINQMKIANDEAAAAEQTLIQYKALQSAGAMEIAGMTANAAIAEAEVTADAAKATAKEAAKKGLIGLAVGAAISAALSLLLGAALGKINQAKSEVASATGASSGRLATGMLTYAEGNYPVLGNDGQVYNAKYEGANIKTGIYGGGAHFGIFSEKKPEAIIDGDTTQRLILNHPDIWQSIVTLSKYGRLNTGMRTFATGNINELARTVETVEADTATDSSAQMMQMQATLDRNSQIMAQLTQVLAGGIKASINMYGDDGLYKQSKKAEKYANRVGYK